MPFISTNTWVLKILDGTMSHKMKALGGYALYDEAFAGAREDAFDPATELSKKHAQFLKEGKVWFIKACQKGHVETARLLLEKGAAVDARTKKGGTALMKACGDGQATAARLLLEKGAEVDPMDSEGETALMLACRSGDAEAARLLLEKGADRSLPTPDGPPLLEVLDQLSLPDEKAAALRAILS